MKIKGLAFLEQHIEKIVLIAVGILCLLLLFTKVVISPNQVQYDNRKFVPGSIDKYVNKQADQLQAKLKRTPAPKENYNPKYDNFLAYYQSPLSNISDTAVLPIPPLAKEDVRKSNRKYAVPPVGEVQEGTAEHLRAVAYIPTGEVDIRNPYHKAKNEPNDLDLVTVEAKFDVAQLYKNFEESYTGSDVPLEWQDPCLAEPVFAAVDLQRQRLLENGRWSEWERVPQAEIQPYKELFKIIEKVENLPEGGMKVRLLQYDSFTIMKELLQPEPYQIASPKEEWYPPTLHAKYEEYHKEIEREERLEKLREKEKEDERTRLDRTRGGMRGRTGTTSRRGEQMGSSLSTLFGTGSGAGRNRGNSRGIRGGRFQNRTGSSTESTTSGRPEIQTSQVSIKNIEENFKKKLIKQNTKLSEMTEPLLFWSYDDAVQPKETYRYRIRLGVFNPLAGTNQFKEGYQSYKDDVILWSKFSAPTKRIHVPGRMYFFPLSVQEVTRSVDIKVAKYVLGYWYSKIFKSLEPGDQIGKVAKPEPLTEEEKKEGVKIPEKIDYGTGAVLLDLVPVKEWTGGTNLKSESYYDMLYSYDGKEIEHMPIRKLFWANDVLLTYNDILISEKQTREPLRDWGSSSRIRRKTTLGTPGEGTPRGSRMQQLFEQILEKQRQERNR